MKFSNKLIFFLKNYSKYFNIIEMLRQVICMIIISINVVRYYEKTSNIYSNSLNFHLLINFEINYFCKLLIKLIIEMRIRSNKE